MGTGTRLGQRLAAGRGRGGATALLVAEHIIGLSALERGVERGSAETARCRYEAVVEAGVLRPRGQRHRDVLDPGRVFALDELAGDGRYVFLSLGARYRGDLHPERSYGFCFDAEQLVRAGALVGPDLLDGYESLADEIARDLDALHPNAPATDEEMAAFATLFGEDDPALLAAVQSASGSRYWDILQALEDGDESTPEAAEAVARFREGAASLQARRRLGGADALARLARGGRLEILWPGELPLAWAIGRVEAGQVLGDVAAQVAEGGESR